MTATASLADLKRSIAEHPDDRASLTRLGFELVMTDPGEAQRHLERVIPLSAGNQAGPRVNLGIAAESAGRLDIAERNYRQALDADPENEKALRRLVRLLAGRRQDDAIAAVLAVPGRMALLNDEIRMVAGATLARHEAHAALSGALIGTLIDVSNLYFAHALRLAIDHRLHVVDDPERRMWMLKVNQLLNPTSAEGAVEIARGLHRKNTLVRAAAWVCQASVLLPDRDDVLTTAAAESARVRWPRHGIATNLRLHARFPGAIEPIERLRTLYKQLDAVDEAKATAFKLIEDFPDKATVWDEAIKILNEFELYADADTLWSKAVTRFPEIPVLHYNRGLSYSGQGRRDEAITNIRRSLCINPQYAKGWNGLSLTYVANEDIDEAIFYAERGLHLGFAQDVLYLNLGVYYRARYRYADSVRASKKAIELTADPQERAAAHFNIGMIGFCCGELETGFRGYMHRWATKNFPSPKRNFKQKIWDGPTTHPNAHLLTYMEQGLGDEVMFSWYIPWVLRDVASLTVDCDKRMIPIFKRSFPKADFVPRGRRGDPATRDPKLTHKAPIGHLPMHYTIETKQHISRIPAEQRDRLPVRNDGYLVPDPDLVAKWRDYFDTHHAGRKRVGVSWRSKIRNRARNLQYLEVEELATVIPPGTTAVNLQYSTEEEEVEIWKRLADERGFTFDPLDGVDLTNDLEDVFAILKVLDYACTPLLSLAWMSGSMGCPTLVNRTAWDHIIWQSFGTGFVPWQPSLRLFFRTPKEPWDGPLERIRTTLSELIERDS